MLSNWQEKIALHGDVASFEELYLHYSPELLRFGMSFLSDREMVEDIVAETFAGLWKKREKLAEIDNIRVYLYACIRNAALNHLQHQQKRMFFPFDQLNVELQPFFETQDPERQCIDRELQAAVARAVDALPPKCRMIFRLAREEGLRYKEIAAILNISVRTIDSQVAIALKRIHAAISPYLVRYP
ncbi:RNA polymerase sigma-70 factor [Chitinophaga rhizosphaerae]|uniref:RNA polymerase sigma-70 factor n=1 Tax=Chitinophaga rhizosphaerae TaxID=1864947 RepID=UPI000F808464|nr:RNA polymerase sigma-70 factor [Chitinophaga rhizosphaerae]